MGRSQRSTLAEVRKKFEQFDAAVNDMEKLLDTLSAIRARIKWTLDEMEKEQREAVYDEYT